MVRLYADGNFPLPVVEELCDTGNNVLKIQEDGRANQILPDEVALSVTKEFTRAVLPLNRKHFARLHFESSPQSGIVLCSFGPVLSGQARHIHEAVTNQAPLEGELKRVNRRAS